VGPAAARAASPAVAWRRARVAVRPCRLV